MPGNHVLQQLHKVLRHCIFWCLVLVVDINRLQIRQQLVAVDFPIDADVAANSSRIAHRVRVA